MYSTLDILLPKFEDIYTASPLCSCAVENLVK